MPAGSSSLGGKSVYVPPSLRPGAGRGAGEMMGRAGGNREDLPTLRVTNVSEDAVEDDLRDLFSRFGRVARVFIGKDRETGIGKGYAFVSYEDRTSAQKAIEKMNGFGALIVSSSPLVHRLNFLLLFPRLRQLDTISWMVTYVNNSTSPQISMLTPLQNRARLDLAHNALL